MAVWWGAGPRGAGGGRVAAGLALLVPDCRGAGQAAGLAPGGKHVSSGIATIFSNTLGGTYRAFF